MNLWRSIEGTLEGELTSAEPENALSAINTSGIPIFSLHWISALTCRFSIRRRDQKKLQALIQKRGETLSLKAQPGIYWTFKVLFFRPVLLLGLLFLLAAVFYLPSRIFFIRVEGNSLVPSRLILEAAEECGISFGASRREVRSEQVKNDLLGAVEQLQWAGVNTSGCVATISVRERSHTQKKEEENVVSNIIAVRDGYILSGTATQGTPLFQIGETVQKGQVLISGYTDCGLSIRATRSEGEIMAQTNHELFAVTPAQYVQKVGTKDTKRKISLIFRKKRTNLWKDSGISEGSCGRMYEEYYAALPGGFRLPIVLCVETYTYCERNQMQISEEEARLCLIPSARDYLAQRMIAGDIRSGTETVVQNNGVFSFTGDYTCVEMIGREQQEQIGETNGKND